VSRNDLNTAFGKRLTKDRKASASVKRTYVVRFLVVAIVGATAVLLFLNAF
jgi:hypothetical protein